MIEWPPDPDVVGRELKATFGSSTRQWATGKTWRHIAQRVAEAIQRVASEAACPDCCDPWSAHNTQGCTRCKCPWPNNDDQIQPVGEVTT